jgi:hypothetical protein
VLAITLLDGPPRLLRALLGAPVRAQATEEQSI